MREIWGDWFVSEFLECKFRQVHWSCRKRILYAVSELIRNLLLLRAGTRYQCKKARISRYVEIKHNNAHNVLRKILERRRNRYPDTSNMAAIYLLDVSLLMLVHEKCPWKEKNFSHHLTWKPQHKYLFSKILPSSLLATESHLVTKIDFVRSTGETFKRSVDLAEAWRKATLVFTTQHDTAGTTRRGAGSLDSTENVTKYLATSPFIGVWLRQISLKLTLNECSWKTSRASCQSRDLRANRSFELKQTGHPCVLLSSLVWALQCLLFLYELFKNQTRNFILGTTKTSWTLRNNRKQQYKLLYRKWASGEYAAHLIQTDGRRVSFCSMIC